MTLAWRAIQDNVDESESLAALGDFAERLYWRLVAKADSWGRLPGSTPKVKARCVPLLDKVLSEIQEALIELHQAGRINRYVVDGVSVIEITDFWRNQPRDATRSRRPSAFPEYQGEREVAATSRDVPPQRQKAEAEADGEGHKAKSSEDRLPINRELETQELLKRIGGDADSNTAVTVRALVDRLPEASIAKVRESLDTQDGIRNRAAYTVGALQLEFAEIASRRSVGVTAP